MLYSCSGPCPVTTTSNTCGARYSVIRSPSCTCSFFTAPVCHAGQSLPLSVSTGPGARQADSTQSLLSLMMMMVIRPLGQPCPRVEQEVGGWGETMVTGTDSLARFKSRVSRTRSSVLAPETHRADPEARRGLGRPCGTSHLHCWGTWEDQRQQLPGQRRCSTCASFQGPLDPMWIPPFSPSPGSPPHFPVRKQSPPSQVGFPLARFDLSPSGTTWEPGF